MTNFNKNPYKEARSAFNRLLFKNNLDKTLDSKFKHKTFSERFDLANTAFLSMGLVAQISSTITAYVMLSYLFDGTPIFVRVIASVTLLVAIEVVKRLSTNDVMQGAFQYKSVEYFPAILSAVTLATSIYIAVEGAKILPDLLIPDAVQEQPIQQSPDAINEDFAARKAEIVFERERYRKERTYQGKLRHEDTNILNQHNEHIKEIQMQKDSALASLAVVNKAARTKSFQVFQERSAEVKVERAALADKLVIAAVGFELLFVISMCFSWWYYVECEKERQQRKKAAATGDTTEVPNDTTQVTGDTTQVEEVELEEVGPRAKKMSFRDYEAAPPIIREEVEKVKKDYTRICPECDTPFVHKNHNHTYCTRNCYLSARKKTIANKS